MTRTTKTIAQFIKELGNIPTSYSKCQIARVIGMVLNGLWLGPITTSKSGRVFFELTSRVGALKKIMADEVIIDEQTINLLPSSYVQLIPEEIIGLSFSKWSTELQQQFENYELEIIKLSAVEAAAAKMAELRRS